MSAKQRDTASATENQIGMNNIRGKFQQRLFRRTSLRQNPPYRYPETRVSQVGQQQTTEGHQIFDDAALGSALPGKCYVSIFGACTEH